MNGRPTLYNARTFEIETDKTYDAHDKQAIHLNSSRSPQLQPVTWIQILLRRSDNLYIL